jgi:hypothetical protein
VTKFYCIHRWILLRPVRNFATIGVCGRRRLQPRPVKMQPQPLASHFCYHHVAFCYNRSRLLLQPAVGDAGTRSAWSCERQTGMLQPAVGDAGTGSVRSCEQQTRMLQPAGCDATTPSVLLLEAATGDATTLIGGCYNRQWRDLQAAMARWKAVNHGVDLLGRGTAVVAELQRRLVAEMRQCAPVLQPRGGRELKWRPRARRRPQA